MTAHIWKILTHKETLWVRWLHAYKLKNRSFWDVSLCSNVSWGWRKLLSIRHIIPPYVWFKLGNGNKASAWYDLWDAHGPVMPHITNRAVRSASFTTFESLSDIVYGADWRWPQSWFHRFPSLYNLTVPILHANHEDNLLWKSNDGALHDFSVSSVWNSVRQTGNEVEWYRLVWSKYGIPRYSIHRWLILRRRLKKQDRLRQWDVGNDVDLTLLRCPLCKLQHDSHEHLFFECPFSSKVWSSVMTIADMPSISSYGTTY